MPRWNTRISFRCTINSVGQDDFLLLMGDFNAWVGSSHSELENVEWSDAIKVTMGLVNEAGRTLLTFCVVNGLTVMNTWYKKKDIYKYTCTHAHMHTRTHTHTHTHIYNYIYVYVWQTIQVVR